MGLEVRPSKSCCDAPAPWEGPRGPGVSRDQNKHMAWTIHRTQPQRKMLMPTTERADVIPGQGQRQ